MKMKDELFVIMMIDKIQSAKEFSGVADGVKGEYVSDITSKSPEYLLDIMVQVSSVLLSKRNEKDSIQTTGKRASLTAEEHIPGQTISLNFVSVYVIL